MQVLLRTYSIFNYIYLMESISLFAWAKKDIWRMLDHLFSISLAIVVRKYLLSLYQVLHRHGPPRLNTLWSVTIVGLGLIRVKIQEIHVLSTITDICPIVRIGWTLQPLILIIHTHILQLLYTTYIIDRKADFPIAWPFSHQRHSNCSTALSVMLSRYILSVHIDPKLWSYSLTVRPIDLRLKWMMMSKTSIWKFILESWTMKRTSFICYISKFDYFHERLWTFTT